MSEQNKAIVRRMFEQVYSGKDLAFAGEVIAENYVGYFPGFERKGVGELTWHFAEDHAGWPDCVITIDEQVAEGDKVVTRWTWRGTNTGTAFSRPPTGKYSTAPGVTISRIVDGKIVEDWWLWDNLGWLAQLGLAAMVDPT